MDKKGTNIVIIADGPYRGMKIHGPRLLIKYKNISVLDRLLNNFAQAFEEYEVFVVSNFKIKKKGIKTLPRKLLMEDCSKLDSIYKFWNTLLIFEDTIPNQYTLKQIAETPQTSSLVFDVHSEISKHDIGGIVDSDKVVQHLSFGLDTKNPQIQKWGHMVYLNRDASCHLRQLSSDPRKQYMMNFEFINHMIDHGHYMRAISGVKVKSLNITCPADIPKVQTIT